MKKAVIAIVSLAAAASVSTGVFFAVRSKSMQETKEKENSAADNILFSFSSDSINKIDIKNLEGTFPVEYNGEDWEFAENSENDFAINQSKMQSICTYFSTLKAETSYGEITEENKAAYGLENPYVITVYEGDTPHTLSIGNISPTGDYYYVSTDEKNKIYAVASEDAEAILSTKLDLINSDLFSFENTEIRKIHIEREGKEDFNLSYNEEEREWQLPDEKYAKLNIDNTEITSKLILLTKLSAEEIIPENSSTVEKYNFEKPAAKLTLTTADGREESILVSGYTQNNKVYSYVYLEKPGLVEKYYTADLRFVNEEIIDILMRSVNYASMYTISEFEVSGENIDAEFKINAAEEWAETDGVKIDLSLTEINSMFKSFYNSFSYSYVEDFDVDAEPELENPILSVKYVLNDGTETTADFTVSDKENLLYVFIDGKYTGLLTENTFFEGNESVTESYRLLAEHLKLGK